MRTRGNKQRDPRPLIEVSGASILTPNGRALFEGLNLCLSRGRVALVGRNGVGKSTLLTTLSGDTQAERGSVKVLRKPHLVPQILSLRPGDRDATAALHRLASSARSSRALAEELLAAGLKPWEELERAPLLSHGELRKLKLIEAKCSGAEILLLDEPTDDLDEAGVSWLREWLRKWPGCLVAASHDRRLLQDFRCFFIARESGCRGFSGTLPELDRELEREHHEMQERYVGSLNRLTAQEEHTVHVARRKARKKQYGRCREIDRATPRARLNQKRDHAQVSHGKLAHVREARIAAAREWSKSMRRALRVNLSLALPVPTLPVDSNKSLLVLRDVSAVLHGRCLFESLSLRVGRARLAVVGPNGAGKTTLLEIMLGRRAPSTGSVERDPPSVGSIAQGGSDWMLDDTLLSYLTAHGLSPSAEAVAKVLVAHKFPLALGERPLHSLSPGERVRAALICLFQRSPAVELLVLDEPTYSLDLVGQRALTEALTAWPGGLVVASHDRAFLSAIGFERVLELGR